MSNEEENNEPEVNEEGTSNPEGDQNPPATEEDGAEPVGVEVGEEVDPRAEGYYCKGNISCDGKAYKVGDKYEGEHAERLLKSGAVEKV